MIAEFVIFGVPILIMYAVLIYPDVTIFILLSLFSFWVLHLMLLDLRAVYRNRDLNADGSQWIFFTAVIPGILLKNSLDRHVDFAGDILYETIKVLVLLGICAYICIEIYHIRYLGPVPDLFPARPRRRR